MQTKAEFYFDSLSKDSIGTVVKNSLNFKEGQLYFTFFI